MEKNIFPQKEGGRHGGTHVSPSDIFDVLKTGNVEHAKKLYQMCHVTYDKDYYLTRHIVNNGDLDLFDIANSSGLVKITKDVCDGSAGVSLPMLRRCVSLIINQYETISQCVTVNASEIASGYGLIDVLQFLKDNNCPFNSGSSMSAIANDQLQV